MGMTTNSEIPMVKSIMDYIARWMALKFLTKAEAMQLHNHELVEKAYTEGSKSRDAFAMRLPVVDEGQSAGTERAMSVTTVAEAEEDKDVALTKTDLAKLQGYTGSMCSSCSSMKMKRNGSCEVCLDCGLTSGCS
jgi:ribonucleoside-diphosphate reductase alpha chain